MKTLYIIRCNGFYKIGIASDARERFFSIQVGNPYDLEMVGQYQIHSDWIRHFEFLVHKKFSELGKHVRGEWFRLSKEDLNYLERNCKVAQEKSLAGYTYVSR